MTVPSLTRFKCCTKCGWTKPATHEFFYRNNRRDSLEASCKVCESLRHAARYRINRKKVLEQTKLYKQKNRDKIAAYHVVYRQQNREQYAENMRRWIEKDPEHYKKLLRQWYENNWERAAKNRRRWRKENPEAVRAYERRYQDRKRGQPGEPYDGKDIKTLYGEQGGRCYYCRVGLSKYHIDHRLPLSRGG